jgi:hypothetical protein
MVFNTPWRDDTYIIRTIGKQAKKKKKNRHSEIKDAAQCRLALDAANEPDLKSLCF